MVGLQEAPSRRPSESHIFDIPVDLARPRELLERITGWVASGERGRRVMYVNAHVLNQSLEHPALRDALHAADLVYCDGYGVRLAARVLGSPVPFRMTGADWIWALARLCELGGHKLYLVGSEPPLAKEAAARLRRAKRAFRPRNCARSGSRLPAPWTSSTGSSSRRRSFPAGTVFRWSRS